MSQMIPLFPPSVMKLVNEALAIQAEEAREAGALGYMARALTQATMPHSKPEVNEFTRSNGNYTLSMMAPSGTGLPYGSIPRLLMAWVTTEAVLTKERRLVLGNSLSAFMKKLGEMGRSGGHWGNIPRVKKQTVSLFSSFVSCCYEDPKQTSIRNILIADEADLWWHPKDPAQTALWESTVLLHQKFFDEIINYPVPVDVRALRALKRSPMKLDMYIWLTYRMSYLRKSSLIPWEGLQMQFGAGYPFTDQGRRNFKKKFIAHMRDVLTVYPPANIEAHDSGLLMKPSSTHIQKLPPQS